MTYRGPDAAGFWDGGACLLAHRRLKVVDLSEAGAQPLVTPDGLHALVYNGELYNDAELRHELTPLLQGHPFASTCDTETLLAALRAWGDAALPRLRGMFAFGYLDVRAGRLTLARDPLGIKPLYWRRWTFGGIPHFAFASAIAPLLGLPGTHDGPDMVAVSAYLTTIRTTLGPRTMYQGVQTLEPGDLLSLDLGDERLTPRVRAWASESPLAEEGDTRKVIIDSIERHLRSDVPLCSLLSGGLDSSIVASIARPRLPELHTYCAGAQSTSQTDDLSFAELASARLGTNHTRAMVTREMFEERWPGMVAALATPLSTPNEVAINEVARTLRADGRIVTLSGEGADELFGGYDMPLASATKYFASGGADPGVHDLIESAWIPPETKASLFQETMWRGVEEDAVLLAWYRQTWSLLASSRADDSPMQVHLRLTRRVNLAGLLARLDTATMLAGVEGRTPLADWVVARHAESLPMSQKYDPATPAPLGTKIALRRAFAGEVPPEVVARPKASFPLPLQSWMDVGAGWMRESGYLREVFTEPAIHAVASRPNELLRLAWPMINLALWGRRWE